MKPTALRALILVFALATSLSACLTSDAPTLATEDLTAPAGFEGDYFATDFSAHTSTIDATVERLGDRVYRLTFIEGDRKDAPVLLRLLKLNDGRLLGVATDEPVKDNALYLMVTQAANGSWVFRMVDLQQDRRTRGLREALTRHGAKAVSFGSGNSEINEIAGHLTAANLRALFSDPDFQQAIEASQGFRLSPKHSTSSGIALE